MATPSQRGTLFGLALFFTGLAHGDIELPDSNYLLIYNKEHPEKSRLLVPATSTLPGAVRHHPPAIPDEVQSAVEALNDPDPKTRTRALTLLSGNNSSEVLAATLQLVHDEDATVREEAFQVALQHRDVDFERLATLGLADSSPRVRATTVDCIAERRGD